MSEKLFIKPVKVESQILRDFDEGEEQKFKDLEKQCEVKHDYFATKIAEFETFDIHEKYFS